MSRLFSIWSPVAQADNGQVQGSPAPATIHSQQRVVPVEQGSVDSDLSDRYENLLQRHSNLSTRLAQMSNLHSKIADLQTSNTTLVAMVEQESNRNFQEKLHWEKKIQEAERETNLVRIKLAEEKSQNAILNHNVRKLRNTMKQRARLFEEEQLKLVNENANLQLTLDRTNHYKMSCSVLVYDIMAVLTGQLDEVIRREQDQVKSLIRAKAKFQKLENDVAMLRDASNKSKELTKENKCLKDEIYNLERRVSKLSVANVSVGMMGDEIIELEDLSQEGYPSPQSECPTENDFKSAQIVSLFPPPNPTIENIQSKQLLEVDLDELLAPDQLESYRETTRAKQRHSLPLKSLNQLQDTPLQTSPAYASKHRSHSNLSYAVALNLLSAGVSNIRPSKNRLSNHTIRSDCTAGNISHTTHDSAMSNASLLSRSSADAVTEILKADKADDGMYASSDIKLDVLRTAFTDLQKEFRDESMKFMNERAQYEGQINKLLAEKAKIEEQVVTFSKSVDPDSDEDLCLSERLRTHTSDLQAENRRLNAQLISQEKKFNDHEVWKRCDMLQKQHMELLKKLEDLMPLQEEVVTLREEKRGLSRMLTHDSERFAETELLLEEKIVSLQQENSELLRSKTIAETRLAEYEKCINSLKDDLEEADQNIKKFEKRIVTLMSDRSDEHEEEKKAYEEQIVSLKVKYNAREEEVTSLRNQLKEHINLKLSYERLKVEKEHLEASLSRGIKVEQVDVDSTFDSNDTKNELDENQLRLERIQSALSKLTKSEKDFEEIVALKTKLQIAEQNLDSKTDEIKQLVKSKESLTESLGCMKADVVRLETSLSQLQSSYDELRKDYAGKMVENERLICEVAQYEEKLHEANDRIEDLQLSNDHHMSEMFKRLPQHSAQEEGDELLMIDPTDDWGDTNLHSQFQHLTKQIESTNNEIHSDLGLLNLLNFDMEEMEYRDDQFALQKIQEDETVDQQTYE